MITSVSVKDKPVCLYSDLQVQKNNANVCKDLQEYIHLSLCKPIFKHVHGQRSQMPFLTYNFGRISAMKDPQMYRGRTFVCNIIRGGSEVIDWRMEECLVWISRGGYK